MLPGIHLNLIKNQGENVFREDLKTSNEAADRMCQGRLFQSRRHKGSLTFGLRSVLGAARGS